MREYKKRRQIQRQNESPEEKKSQLKKEQEYIKKRIKSQNDSPANRSQKLLKQKDSIYGYS